MELDISNFKFLIGDIVFIFFIGRKLKKKSVLFKFVEKKRRFLESGSEVGLCVLL